MNLITEFESLIILRTIMNEKDMNFICIDDLDEISLYAEELNIDIKYVNLDDIYNSEYNTIIDVFNKWYDNINQRYYEITKILLRCLYENFDRC